MILPQVAIHLKFNKRVVEKACRVLMVERRVLEVIMNGGEPSRSGRERQVTLVLWLVKKAAVHITERVFPMQMMEGMQYGSRLSAQQSGCSLTVLIYRHSLYFGAVALQVDKVADAVCEK